jgi:hypothetical protein
MTALNLSQIPSSCNTLAKLAVWLGATSRAVDGTKTAIEVDGLLPERASQMPIIEGADGKIYAVIRMRVELDTAYMSSTSGNGRLPSSQPTAQSPQLLLATKTCLPIVCF